MGDLNSMIMDQDIEFKDTASEGARDLMRGMLQKSARKRMKMEDILGHEWLADAPEWLDIFDEQERDLIRKEFTYVSCKAKLKNLPGAKETNLNTEFTEHSVNTTENELLRNNSTRSVILCPFNSTDGKTEILEQAVGGK